jgi:predicted RNA-binding Zn-ribbon protein involved in translation (DUF1610 family)
VTVTCPVCGAELEGREAIEAHEHEIPLAWEDAGAGFQCPTCGEWFSSEEELVVHEATVHSVA